MFFTRYTQYSLLLLIYVHVQCDLAITRFTYVNVCSLNCLNLFLEYKIGQTCYVCVCMCVYVCFESISMAFFLVERFVFHMFCIFLLSCHSQHLVSLHSCIYLHSCILIIFMQGRSQRGARGGTCPPRLLKYPCICILLQLLPDIEKKGKRKKRTPT